MNQQKKAHRARVLEHCDQVAARAARTKTFYAVITQYDCDPKKNPPGTDGGARGPLLIERYLDVPEALCEEATQKAAEMFARSQYNYGWARVAKVTIEIPDEDESAHSTQRPPDEGAPPGGE